MNPRFTHIAFLVSDLEKTINFYTKYCALKVLDKRIDKSTGDKVAWIGKDLKFIIVAIQTKNKPIQSSLKPLSHLGFSLDSKEEVDHIADIAKKEGLLNFGPTYLEPVEIVGYICEILDPDGNSIEFSFGQKLG